MVSIRRVFVIVLLIISKIQIIFWFKRGTATPRLQMKVLRKPAQTDMEQAAHAYSVRTTMPVSCLL